jgi:ABC-2 type transport system permease protein
MNNLRGMYAVWQREMIIFFREKPRIISEIVNPLFWLLTLGAGLGATVVIEGLNYQQFIFAGILTQTFLFSSIFYGSYLVWDRRIDLLKAVLVSPLSRSSIFFGKVLGGVTISLFQALIILAFGHFIGIHYTILSIAATLLIVLVATAALTALGLTIGSLMTSPEGFQLIITFVIFPLFFLSGALFPLNNLPSYLGVLTSANPITYIVDMLRGLLIGLQHFPTINNLLILAAFTIVMNFAGVQAFKRMRA